MTALTFGVFIPQGWKMELSSITDPRAKWAKAVEIAVLAEELGLDSLWVYDHFHNVVSDQRKSGSVINGIRVG